MILSELKTRIVASGKLGADPNAVTEAWVCKDQDEVFCVRVQNICYAVLQIAGDTFEIVVNGLKSKPSMLSKVAGAYIDSDKGENPIKLSWIKLGEKEKGTTQRTLMTGEYKEGNMTVKWDEKMALAINNKPISIGPITPAQSKMLVSAMNSYALRCRKTMDPEGYKKELADKKKVKKDEKPARAAGTASAGAPAGAPTGQTKK